MFQGKSSASNREMPTAGKQLNETVTVSRVKILQPPFLYPTQPLALRFPYLRAGRNIGENKRKKVFLDRPCTQLPEWAVVAGRPRNALQSSPRGAHVHTQQPSSPRRADRLLAPELTRTPKTFAMGGKPPANSLTR